LHPLLVKQGDRPVALVRSDRRHNELKALGAEVRLLDIEDSDTAEFAAALGDTDAIVSAAPAAARTATSSANAPSTWRVR
jgi:uncharacterized protein YbjT (DUF2867 family)